MPESNRKMLYKIINIQKRYCILTILGFIACIISSIFIGFSEKNDVFSCYSLLPISYAVFLLITMFCNSRIYEKSMFLLFLCLYFVKLVVTPMIFALSGWKTIANTDVFVDNLDFAIALSVWEPVFVGVGIVLYSFHVCKTDLLKSCYFKEKRFRFDGADFLICIGVLFVIIVLLYYPSLRVRFAWLPKIGSNYDVNPVVKSISDFFSGEKKDVPLGIIDDLMMRVFYVVRVLFPIMLIQKINKTNMSSRRKVIISLIVIVMALQITTEKNSETMLTGVALVLLLFMIYPRFKRKYGGLIIGLGVLAGVVLLMWKNIGTGSFGNESIIDTVSTVLNAYMNGPVNVSVAIKASDNYSVVMFFKDILGGLPFLNRFVDGYSTSVLFNETFWEISGRTDMLLPSLGQGYMYFGALLCPILQLMFVVIGISLENVAERTQSIKIKGYFIFVAVITTFTVGNNLSHILGFWLCYLPGIIILWFERYRIKLLQ